MGHNTYVTKEYVKRREEGRCFQCGQQFGPLHRCHERKLKEGDEAESDGVEFVESSPNNDQQRSATECNMLNLSFFSLNGFSRPKTMKMKGTVGDNLVMVMVDNGASHFISQSMIQRLRLPTT
ncbi:hypothetical protein CR513_01904, partial [Mucuna pruriens]